LRGRTWVGAAIKGRRPNPMQERMEWFQGLAACLNRSGALGIGLGVLLHGARWQYGALLPRSRGVAQGWQERAHHAH